MTFGTNRTDQERDAALFDSLFEQHRNVVFSFLFGRCGDRELAKDLLQETFMRVWRNIAEAAKVPEDRTRFWIVAIARNIQIDDSRRKAVRPATLPQAANLDAADARQAPDSLVESKHALAKIDRAIMELPDELRTVLVLSAMEGLNSKEIGDLLGLSPGTARYKLSEARRRILDKVDVE